MTEPTGAPADPVRTGVEAVDEVIAAVEGLDARPLAEHVAVFETAHEQLRRALDVPAAVPGAPAGLPADAGRA